MTEVPLSSNELLSKILDVLGNIDDKLKVQEEQFKCLEALVKANSGNGGINESNGSDSTVDDSSQTIASKHEFDGIDGKLPSSPGSPRLQAAEVNPKAAILSVKSDTTKYPYTEWDRAGQVVSLKGNLVSVEFYLSASGLLKSIQDYLGDWWAIPDDHRIRLTFSNHAYHKAHEPMRFLSQPPRAYYSDSSLRAARQFDTNLRALPGNDFLVIDFDELNNSRIYRLGQKAVGNPLMVESGSGYDAPWSRLIVYQGMTSGDSIKPNKQSIGSSRLMPIPYFRSGDATPGLWRHLFSHLQLKRRNVTVNPYTDPSVGFHTTFYEIIQVKDQHNELWKHGPLYNDPAGRSFRKCAYTLYSPPPKSESLSLAADTGYLSRHWTILLMTPGYFFDQTNKSFPMKDLSADTKQTVGLSLSQLTRLGAEMHLISQGLQRINDRWADFQAFFEYILDSGDSLMQPTQHDNLLFDDGSFSRSRRYFWAIDCLAEFDLSITDNITQWELYRASRFSRVEPSLPELDYLQYKNAEEQYNILKNQREYFRQKLASTKALRDALFNASAVIESRASTRLGENVKLLTFVSIFFLPLSFCTSLWSVNSLFSTTALIYTITTVGTATYLIVLNINTLVQSFSRLYQARKSNLVNAMKTDPEELWKLRGQRFEIFRPRHENPQPSEWYMLLYAMLHPWVLLGFKTGGERNGGGGKRHLTWRIWPFGKATKEPEERDEAWVIE
ncbi:MAG: hypothetical protein Q9187_002719 [Circinaria calcarea]